MCLYSKKDKLKSSNRNITCYKVLETSNGELRSPYIGKKYVCGMNVPYERKVLFRRRRRGMLDLSGTAPNRYKYEVSEGVLHAYTSLIEAIRDKQNLEKWERFEEEPCTYKIYKCFVPRETEYVTGWLSEIAAKSTIFERDC